MPHDDAVEAQQRRQHARPGPQQAAEQQHEQGHAHEPSGLGADGDEGEARIDVGRFPRFEVGHGRLFAPVALLRLLRGQAAFAQEQPALQQAGCHGHHQPHRQAGDERVQHDGARIHIAQGHDDGAERQRGRQEDADPAHQQVPPVGMPGRHRCPLACLAQGACGQHGQPAGEQHEGQAGLAVDVGVDVAVEGNERQQGQRHDEGGAHGPEAPRGAHAVRRPVEVGLRQPQRQDERVQEADDEDGAIGAQQGLAPGLAPGHALQQIAQSARQGRPGSGMQQGPAQSLQGVAEAVLERVVHARGNLLQCGRGAPRSHEQGSHGQHHEQVQKGRLHEVGQHARGHLQHGAGVQRLRQMRRQLQQPGQAHRAVAGDPEQLALHEVAQLGAPARDGVERRIGLLQHGDAAAQQGIELVHELDLGSLPACHVIGRGIVCRGGRGGPRRGLGCSCGDAGDATLGLPMHQGVAALGEVVEPQAQVAQLGLDRAALLVERIHRGQCKPLLPQPVADGGVAAPESQAGLGVAQGGGDQIAGALGFGQRSAVGGEALGIGQQLVGEMGVFARDGGDAAVGGGLLRGQGSHLGGELLQAGLAHGCDAAAEPVEARGAQGFLLPQAVQGRFEGALTQIAGVLLQFGHGQRQTGLALLGAVLELPGLGEGGRLALYLGQRGGGGVGGTAQGVEPVEGLARAGDEAGELVGGAVDARAQIGLRAALLGEQAFERVAVGIGRNAPHPGLQLGVDVCLCERPHGGSGRSALLLVQGLETGGQSIAFLFEG